MIENVNAILGNVARTDLGKAARRSARTIWNAHRAAFETTRVEAGKVFGLAINESQKFSSRGRDVADSMVGNLVDVIDALAARVDTRTSKKSKRRTTRRAA